jgi:hypothetical protein
MEAERMGERRAALPRRKAHAGIICFFTEVPIAEVGAHILASWW